MRSQVEERGTRKMRRKLPCVTERPPRGAQTVVRKPGSVVVPITGGDSFSIAYHVQGERGERHWPPRPPRSVAQQRRQGGGGRG